MFASKKYYKDYKYSLKFYDYKTFFDPNDTIINIDAITKCIWEILAMKNIVTSLLSYCLNSEMHLSLKLFLDYQIDEGLF